MGGINWINLAQDRQQWQDLLNTVMNIRINTILGNFMNSLTTGGFSRSTPVHRVRNLMALCIGILAEH
jgi:hypothetical protein